MAQVSFQLDLSWLNRLYSSTLTESITDLCWFFLYDSDIRFYLASLSTGARVQGGDDM